MLEKNLRGNRNTQEEKERVTIRFETRCMLFGNLIFIFNSHISGVSFSTSELEELINDYPLQNVIDTQNLLSDLNTFDESFENPKLKLAEQISCRLQTSPSSISITRKPGSILSKSTNLTKPVNLPFSKPIVSRVTNKGSDTIGLF
jgi:hypothetical protein